MTATHVIVTGGAGYIGSHACHALAAAGFEPVVYDNFSTGWRDLVKFGPLVEGDVRDADGLAAAFATWRPAALLHFAAVADVGRATRDPLECYDVNVRGALTAAGAARAADVRSIVFSSTCAVYGEPQAVPIDEAHPLAPISVYGRSKLMAETALTDMAASGLHTIALRYFNAAGAAPDAGVGERHVPETHALPLAIEAAAGGAPFRLFGDDYDTPDGSAIRDYIHVADLAAAHVAALQSLLAGGAGGAYNLGAGAGVSVKELLKTVSDVMGAEVAVERGPRRAGDPSRLIADARKAAADLNWRPQRSFRQTVEDAAAWRALDNQAATLSQ